MFGTLRSAQNVTRMLLKQSTRVVCNTQSSPSFSSLSTASVSKNAIIRQFSTTVQFEAPIISGRSGESAREAFEASVSDKSADTLLKDLRTFSEYYKQDENFRVALLTPALRAERDNILGEVFENNNISNTHARHLINTLAERGHLEKVPKVIHDIESLSQYQRQEMIAKVTSAEPLNNEQLNNLTSALRKRVPSGTNLIIEQVVEPSILGGLSVQLGNQSIDVTVVSRVAEIDRLMRAARA